MTPTFLVSARRKKRTIDRILALLAEADRFELMARHIASESSKPSNWIALWVFCSERAVEERRWAAALASGAGIDLANVIHKHIQLKGRAHAK